MKHELTEESELAAIAGEWQIPECTEPEVVNGAALPHVVTGAELYAGPMKHELTEESELAAIAGEWQIPECTEPEVVNGAALPHVVTGAELYAGRVVRLRPLIEGLIWDGLTMIVAKPKAGKSWLMLQCAVDIAGGPAVSGVTALDHGPVLYGAFEEPEPRTMVRLRKLAHDRAL